MYVQFMSCVYGVTVPEKKRFNNSIFFSSSVLVTSSSTRVILSVDLILLANKGLAVL